MALGPVESFPRGVPRHKTPWVLHICQDEYAALYLNMPKTWAFFFAHFLFLFGH